MNAEIIAAGSEMLTPQKIDTNSLWLTARLNELGVEVTRKTVAGDDRDFLADAIRGALERAQIVVVTGGLGPTEDDVTREATAQALHRRLLFSEEILAAIQARFDRLGRKMAERNRRQAFLVDGAEKLDNPFGTAPGQWLDLPGGMMMLLPGPPRELQPMVESLVLPRLRERVPPLRIVTRFYRAAGIGESDLDERIAPIYKGFPQVATTILASEGDVQVHLRMQSESAEEASRVVDELGGRILAELGRVVYSTDGAPLEATIGETLKARGSTLAVAESCTGGLLGARLTETPGASEWFLGGFLVYGSGMKTRLLGIDERLVESQGAVSEAAALAMAESARARIGATYALAITGEAGPESASPGVEPGTVWIGLATPDGVEARMFRFPNGRARVRAFAAQNALNILRLKLR
jgi:nicotinamide-nucleotide amidase